jgi:4-methylaminobutanoate oxidase (formaldehyde-forming)
MAGEKAGQHPITILLDAATYTRPELGGLVIGVQESRSATFDARELPDDPATFSIAMGEDHWDALIDASTSIESLCPAIHEARFSSYLAGLSTYTPDGQLVLGEVPGIRGLYAASGCCGSGVMLSAGIGEAAASLLLGQDPPFDLWPYRPDRFGKIDPFGEEFRQLCAQSRSNKIQPQVS